jgi:hypothetical protein
MRRIIPALLLLLVGASAAQQSARISVSPARIAEGDSAVVSWATFGDSAFIPGLGMVGPRGLRVIRPTATRTIYLLSAGGARTDSVVIAVDGTSRDGTINDESFKFARTYVVRGKNLTALLDGVGQILEHQFGYPASGYAKRPLGVWVITTATRERPDLVSRATEPTIGLRRVAYRVQVNPRPDGGSYQCEIAVLVEYRKRVERDYRLEPSEALYASEVERLATALAWAR